MKNRSASELRAQFLSSQPKIRVRLHLISIIAKHRAPRWCDQSTFGFQRRRRGIFVESKPK